MSKFKIEIISPFGADSPHSGIYGANGAETPVGTILELDREPTDWRGRYRIVSGGDGDETKAAITNPAEKPVAPLTATDQGGGWWGITDANGKAWGKKLRKDDAEAFNGMSDEDKAAFVAED